MLQGTAVSGQSLIGQYNQLAKAAFTAPPEAHQHDGLNDTVTFHSSDQSTAKVVVGPDSATVEIQPELCGLEWASGTVPTPTGDIKVRVAQKGQHIVLDVNLPRGVTAHTILPGKVTQKIQGQHIHAEAVVPG